LRNIVARKKLSSIQIIVFILIFLCGTFLRFVDFDDPPLDFHPARQLHSALIARSYFLKDNGNLPGKSADYQHEAEMRGSQEPRIEPPIMERLAAWGYKIVGDADLRVPRAMSIVFWLIGGIGLFRLCRRFLGITGSLVGFGFFLLFPYTIFASRSFQPDPLMVALMIWSLNALVEWDSHPAIGPAILTGVLTGIAILVKQVCVFPLASAFAFYIFSSSDRKQRIKRVDFWIIVALSVAPVLVYNYWGYFIKGFLVQQYQGRFSLSDWLSPAFYVRWIRKMDEVFGIVVVIAGLVGCLACENRRARLLWIGFFAGYILYGLALPHHIGTHDYYQLPLFPLISFGIGRSAESIFEVVGRLKEGRTLAYVGITVCLIQLGAWWSADSVISLNRRDYRAWPERWQSLAAELDPYPGQINTIGIMDDYGAAMIYWGLRTPVIWEQNIEKLSEEEADTIIRQAMINREYLIVTDLDSFYAQPRLQNWLVRNTKLYAEEPEYLIYDLRGLNE